MMCFAGYLCGSYGASSRFFVSGLVAVCSKHRGRHRFVGRRIQVHRSQFSLPRRAFRYRIAANKKNPAQLNIDGYKIVDGSPQFMGALTGQYLGRQGQMSCTANTGKQDDWEFHVTDDTMTGTLTIGAEKTLYRRIIVRKIKAN